MFYFNKDLPLTQDKLFQMISKFDQTVVPVLEKNKNYYDGIQKILQKQYSDKSKPNNQTVINYCKNIVDSYCGYMATPGCISYNSDNNIDDIMEVLKYNDYQAEDSDFLLDALIYGTAAELMYVDHDGKTRFRTIDPRSCFGIFDDCLTNELLYFVRRYKSYDWNTTETDEYYVDVYSDKEVIHYKCTGKTGSLTLLGIEGHYFNQCPANIFTMPDEKSVFDCIISLQDTVNELISTEVDDYSAFCDAYLVLNNVDADTDSINTMKENRVLVLPQGATASWLTKSANDTQVENILKRAHDSIYRISSCVDFSSETFTGGVSSGIAIQFKLSGMEQRAGKIEAQMKKALQRRIELICGIASLKLGEEVFRDINILFTRNVPADETAIVNMVNALKGTVSDATLLTQIPFVTDVDKELEAVKEQKTENMSLYSFGNITGEDGTESEDNIG